MKTHLKKIVFAVLPFTGLLIIGPVASAHDEEREHRAEHRELNQEHRAEHHDLHHQHEDYHDFND
ncbi:MAG: hypothetical protein AB7G75_09540 [Candidatus Binatia bacterium]